jgi:hypothetical protein
MRFESLLATAPLMLPRRDGFLDNNEENERRGRFSLSVSSFCGSGEETSEVWDGSSEVDNGLRPMA